MPHKIFLAWLIYLVVIILAGAGLCYLGIPQIAIHSDHSYLTVVLLGMYAISEIMSARQAWKMSSEHVIAAEATVWLQQNPLSDILRSGDAVVLVGDFPTKTIDQSTHLIPTSETATHILSLKDMSADGNHVDQGILLDVLSDHLHGRIALIEFLAGRVVWVGILATIIGVILAFWPLLGAGMAIDAIRLKLGDFFSGIAVAFIPTAASFVFKIALDFSTKILSTGAAEIVATLARISETKILPFFERKQ
jgi:hypothetical protein